MSNFYIADTHFGHSNIIKYDNRPFLNIEEMNNSLIKNWNNKVIDNDTVYILGDFSWYSRNRTKNILDKLKGRKILIKGNHDKDTAKLTEKFDGIYDYLEIKDGIETIIMSHYPMLFWNSQFKNTIHLYGHIHNSSQYNFCKCFQQKLKQKQNIPMRMYNVGCMIDYMNYTPQTIGEIIRGA